MKVGVVGLGPIGLEVAAALAAVEGFDLVGAADVSTQLARRRLAELVPSAPPSAMIDPSLGRLLDRGVQAVALCTSSQLPRIAGDLADCISAGVHVVSTCEELAAPVEAANLVALHKMASQANVTVLGTGVNPGFVMDRLPLQLAGVCLRVRGVKVERRVDAGKRRKPLRQKVGHGITVEEFHRGVAEGRLGHVGLTASARILAQGLGTTIQTMSETVDPVTDAAGLVLGVRQRLVAKTADARPIELLLEMYVGAPSPEDRVLLDADPPVDLRIAGGMQGDRATVAAVVDGLRRVEKRAPRGVITVADVY